MIKNRKNLLSLLLVMMLCIFPNKIYALQELILPELEEIKASKSHKNVEELINELPDHVDQDDPYLILINPYNASSDMLLDHLATSNEGIPFSASIEKAVNDLFQASIEAGFNLVIVSGYRTTDQQAYLESSRIQSFMASGYSREEAKHLTNLYTAPANATEHMTGLALDILGQDWTSIGGGLTQDYGDYPSAQWLVESAADYGFILRYPQNKKNITTFNYEPWHFRYVGKENAQFIMKHGITLEEYLALINERDHRQEKERVQIAAQQRSIVRAEKWLKKQSNAIRVLFDSQMDKHDND